MNLRSRSRALHCVQFRRRGTWPLGLFVALAVALIMGTTGAKPAYAAATITVNTTNDEAATDGKCSLREAINNANAGTDTSGGDCAPGSPSGSTIDLSSLNGTITLVSAFSLITANVTIIGPGSSKLMIDANGNFDVFNVRTVTAAISGVTLTGGGVFGGIVNGGILTVQNTTISGNHTTNDGGGIENFGTLSLNNSTVSGNTGFPAGGGIDNDGALSVTNSTISGNGGVLFGGGIENTFGTLSITNSTVSGNTATNEGGGIGNDTGNLTIQNATITGNSAGSGGGILTNRPISLSNKIVADQAAGANCGGFPVINDLGYNLDDGTSCGFTSANHSQSNTNPLLDPAGLKDNGGPTQTIALLAGSPAIDAIPPGINGCGTTITSDQRGVSRPQGPGCDIGAFERVQDTTPPVITVPGPITTNATSQHGAVVTYSVSATDPDDAVASLMCVPASGSTFPIGTTTVTCTATDTHGNSATASFTVHVEGAAEQLADLGNAVIGAGPGTSLADKVKQAQTFLASSDVAETCSTLTAFVNEVKAQPGKTITTGQAQALIATATRIKTVLGC